MLPSEHALLPVATRVTIGEARVDGDALVVAVSMTGASAPLPDPDEVLRRVRGRSAQEAVAALADLGTATVNLWPDWVQSVPELDWRIDLRIDSAADEPVSIGDAVSTIIGLDHGARRIGVAVGDTETGMAFARPAIRRRSLAVDLHEVEQLAWAEGAELIVVGLPLNMDGSEGDQAAAARSFGEGLTENGLRVAFEDERLSTWEAGEQLRARPAGGPPGGRAGSWTRQRPA